MADKQETKRRRVTRACDNCRQKKVKCDGKQPCIHCTVYSYKCTYDQPNIRNKRNLGIPQLLPNAGVIGSAALGSVHKPVPKALPSNNLILAQNILNLLLPKLKLNCLDDVHPMKFDFDKFQKVVQYLEQRKGLVNMLEVMDLYLDGNPAPSITSATASPVSLSRRLLNSLEEQMNYPREIRLILPPKETALQLIYTTWEKACVLFRFYHRPSLLDAVDAIYLMDPSQYGDKQQKFLPFLYSILACGSLFSKLAELLLAANEGYEDDGFRYFLEARKLIDISNVGDISSIQTIVMMIMYLQCSARLSTCYSYIGIALRLALKEGLHRNLSIFQNGHRKLDPIEIDTRKRLFYTIYKMDIYINSLLGLPRSINEDEFDQDFPAELDDENITRSEYLYENQQGRLSSSGCANHHTKLMLVLSHIIRKLYPIKVKKTKQDLDNVPPTPDHIHTKVTELEMELKTWLDNLPKELRPTDPNDPTSDKDIPQKFLLANYYLQLSFLNCQIMLYRPFIHFVSNQNPALLSSHDPRSLIRGRNCIKVARMVVKLANKMIDQKLLVGTYWFLMYTIFFSIACLIYYYHFANTLSDSPDAAHGGNYAGVLFDDDLDIDQIKRDIEIGKKVLDCLKNNSNASLRIYNILNTLFEQLNRRTASTTRAHGTNGFNFKKATIEPASDRLDRPTIEAPKPQSATAASTALAQSQLQPVNSTNGSNYLAYSLQDSQSEDPLGQAFSYIKSVNKQPETLDDDFLNSYVPGVFDKLDAQIFGKILPPYMLEKNYQIQRALLQRNTPTDTRANSPAAQGQFNAQAGQDGATRPATNDAPASSGERFGLISNLSVDLNELPNVKMEDLDFMSFGDANLDYLDPFNPMPNSKGDSYPNLEFNADQNN